MTEETLYIEPDEVVLTPARQASGYMTFEVSDYVLKARSAKSEEEAEQQLKIYAGIIGANAIIEYRTWIEKGRYFFWRNYFCCGGRAATVAEPSPEGDVTEEDLYGVNELAEEKQEKLLIYLRNRRIAYFAIALLLFIIHMPFYPWHGTVFFIIGLICTLKAQKDDWLNYVMRHAPPSN